VIVKESTFTGREAKDHMYVHPNGFEHLVHGEPAPEALFREEYYAEKHQDDQPTELIEPSLRQRALLLRGERPSPEGRFCYQAVQPPSTINVWPVT
jgi:hypothetical protein